MYNRIYMCTNYCCIYMVWPTTTISSEAFVSRIFSYRTLYAYSCLLLFINLYFYEEVCVTLSRSYRLVDAFIKITQHVSTRTHALVTISEHCIRRRNKSQKPLTNKNKHCFMNGDIYNKVLCCAEPANIA